MGNSQFKERCEKAAKTKMLTADACDVDDWDDVWEYAKKTGLDQCRSISLAKNKLKGPLPPKVLVKMPCFAATLKTLDLSHNKITSIAALVPGVDVARARKDAAYLVSLAAGKEAGVPRYPLETLNVSDNQLTELPPLLFVCLPKLKTLNAASNKIATTRDATCIALVAASSLTVVDLSHNQLTEMPFGDFLAGSLGAYSGDADALRDATLPLVRVEALNLAHNRISVVTVAGQGCPKLRDLSVAYQGVADESKEGTTLVTVDDDVFANCPKLNPVNLNGNAQRKKIIEALHGSDAYKAWSERHAGTVSKQFFGGTDARLID